MNENRSVDIKSIAPFIGLFAVIVLFQVSSGGRLLTASNLGTILNTLFTYLLISMGATFVFTSGGLDLSVGALLALCGLGIAYGANRGSVLLGLVLALLIGVISGFINASVQVLAGIPPFIMSLCLQYIYRGYVVYSSESRGKTATIPVGYKWIDNTYLKLTVVVAFFIILSVLFNYTRIGKDAKAVGGNSEAATQAGVSVLKTKVICYVITGVCVAVASLFTTVRQTGVATQTGNGLELDVMVAVVIGGLGIRGGAASRMRCCILGSVITAVLSNGLILSDVPATLVEGIKGLLFLIVVAAGYERRPNDIMI